MRRCGICGSDLHAKDHADELTEVMTGVGYPDFMRGDTPVVMGHEFCGEVAERGRGVGKQFKAGTPVVSFPLVRANGGIHLTGLSPLAPGGFAEQVLAEASMSFAVPNGLDLDTAALTEPMAVALHAVRRSEIKKRDVALVIGCGPVGLAVICHLKALGVRTIVASDFSATRRALATRCGADVVVDPAVDSPTRPAVSAAPSPPHRTSTNSASAPWRNCVASRAGNASTGPPRHWAPPARNDRSCSSVGVPGMIDGIVGAAPLQSRVIVVGVCMGDDRLRPAMAIGKEIEMRFVFGYTRWSSAIPFTCWPRARSTRRR